MTTTSPTGVTFVQAAELLDAHLADHQLPEPTLLTVMTRVRHSEISVQVRFSTVPDVAAELLCWADTLTTITVQAWRLPEGDRVQLSIGSTMTGLAGTVELDVYGGATYDQVYFGDLAPGQQRSASVAELHGWAANTSGASGVVGGSERA
jgi:hypothetical protein